MNLKNFWTSFQENPMVVFIIGSILLGLMSLGFLQAVYDDEPVPLSSALGIFFVANIFIRFLQYRIVNPKFNEYRVSKLRKENLRLRSENENQTKTLSDWKACTGSKSPKSFERTKVKKAIETKPSKVNDDNNKKISTLNNDLRHKLEEIKDLKKTQDKLSKEVQNKTDCLLKLESENSKLDAALKLAEESILERKREESALEKNYSESKAKIVGLELEIRSLRESSYRIRTDFESLKEKYDKSLHQCSHKLKIAGSKIQIACGLIEDSTKDNRDLLRWKVDMIELIQEGGALHKILEQYLVTLESLKKNDSSIDLSTLEDNFHADLDDYLSKVETLI